MSWIQRVALLLIIVGAINWGLIGLFQYDLVAGLFGGGEQSGAFARVIYTLVGISGLIAISIYFSPAAEYSDSTVESTE
ncbi:MULTISPECIES: DUF378 domain-containing protein [Halobacillus]|uniref:DUF378 domain-containing protein n=2 Tax=Halobacillus TaxID=45667 RepID=I0JQ08_HALH3|nr:MULTISPECIES: DUF378 domain-containing protein [Halobacillus]ASF40247.1 DUF378 domain-containing protein [Halobacillus halophilus]MCA1011059.1 DUF378 domain-containing protein [Halobacillus halophilus]CCG46228.1 conserved hypothetical protein [Halobacillus halophilus DSM 2266]SFG02941.1 hypothetical protein SAMN05216353_11945 [Halobacillus alkaliphilus]